MTTFVVFVFVMMVILSFVMMKLSSHGGAKRLRQREAVAEQFRLAAAELLRRAGQPPSQSFPAVPPSQHPQPSPPPAPSMTQSGPTAVTHEPEPDTALSSSLDTSLSTTLGSPMAEPDDSVPTGPQIVALTPDLERRVRELMEQNYEVMAVRLLCDELHIGILDAYKTVRALVGLPTTY